MIRRTDVAMRARHSHMEETMLPFEGAIGFIGLLTLIVVCASGLVTAVFGMVEKWESDGLPDEKVMKLNRQVIYGIVAIALAMPIGLVARAVPTIHAIVGILAVIGLLIAAVVYVIKLVAQNERLGRQILRRQRARKIREMEDEIFGTEGSGDI